jgi:hypothetical protein
VFADLGRVLAAGGARPDQATTLVGVVRLAIIPWADGDLLDGDHERLDEFPGLPSWWRSAERAREASKGDANRLSLRGQIDFQGKLRKQFPIAAPRSAAREGAHRRPLGSAVTACGPGRAGTPSP